MTFQKGNIPWNKDGHLTLETRMKISFVNNKFANGKRRYCCGCEKFYKPEEYNAFRNPMYCDNCNSGKKLRIKGRNYYRSIRNARYAYYH